MNVETVREYCLNKKGVTESFPFDDVSLVVKVMNKMFALIDLEEANHIALKCDPEKAIELREHYSGIEGAYHFNKKYWNSVRFESDVNDKLMKELIDHSYDEVIKKFTKKLRAEYDALPLYIAGSLHSDQRDELYQQLFASSLRTTTNRRVHHCGCRLSNVRTRTTWQFVGSRT